MYDIKPRFASGLPGDAWQETINPFRNLFNTEFVKTLLSLFGRANLFNCSIGPL
jgi:hypothetical protein